MKALSTYYVRAYAITSKEIFYGNEQVFTTTDLAVPTVRTEKVTHFTRTSAVCGGEVLLEGTAVVTEGTLLLVTGNIACVYMAQSFFQTDFTRTSNLLS